MQLSVVGATTVIDAVGTSSAAIERCQVDVEHLRAQYCRLPLCKSGRCNAIFTSRLHETSEVDLIYLILLLMF